MKYVVMKFGGLATSTKKNREHIIDIIKEHLDKKIIIVVSAMGRNGFPYATDTLKNLVDESNLSNKEINRLLAVGEIIASIVLSNQLRASNINSYAMSIQETGIYSKSDSFYLNGKIKKYLELYNVIVVPGFTYLDENNEIQLFNRGGSDLTAIILGNYLKTSNITLYKDVDGIYPFYSVIGLKDVKTIKKLSYEEAVALSNINFQVVQKDAILFAQKNKITINIQNYLTKICGTIISNEASNNKIIGMSYDKDTLLLATLNPRIIKDELNVIFLQNRLYPKSVILQDNYLIFKFGINQLQSAKKIVINTYFDSFLG